MSGMSLLKTVRNGLFEGDKIRIIFGIQTMFLDKLPETFNQIEIEGIGREGGKATRG